MIDSELPTDLRRPGTPSRGPASAVLAHPSTNGLAPVLGAEPRSGAPGHRISRRQSKSLIRLTRRPERDLVDAAAERGAVDPAQAPQQPEHALVLRQHDQCQLLDPVLAGDLRQQAE